MRLKEIYKKNLGRKYRNVIDTKGREAQIQSSPIKAIKDHKYPILIGTLLVIIILLLTFHNTLNTFFVAIVFLLFFVGLSIVFNNYTIKCQKDKLSLKWSFQKFDLPYTHLKGVFLSKEFSGLDVIPMVTYSIVIRYVDNMNFIRELTFPASLLKAEELNLFLDNFVVEENEAEDCVKFEKYKRFKMIMKLIGFILLVILVGVVVYASFI